MISFALVKTDGQARHATLQWDRMYVGPLRYQVRVHRLTMAGTAGRSGLLVKMVLLARRIDMSLLRGHMCPVRTPVSGAVTVYVMSHTFADKVLMQMTATGRGGGVAVAAVDTWQNRPCHELCPAFPGVIGLQEARGFLTTTMTPAMVTLRDLHRPHKSFRLVPLGAPGVLARHH